jgi:hypothetical protein
VTRAVVAGGDLAGRGEDSVTLKIRDELREYSILGDDRGYLLMLTFGGITDQPCDLASQQGNVPNADSSHAMA